MSKYITKNADRYDPIDRFRLYFSGYPNRPHDRAAMISQIISTHRNNPDIQKSGLPNLDFKSNFRRPLNLTEGSKDSTLPAQTSIDKIRHQFFDNAFTTFYILNQVYRRVDRNDALI